jgi:hypothetical protein
MLGTYLLYAQCPDPCFRTIVPYYAPTATPCKFIKLHLVQPHTIGVGIFQYYNLSKVNFGPYAAASAAPAVSKPLVPLSGGLETASKGAACRAGFSASFILPLLFFSIAALTQSATSLSSTTSIGSGSPLSPAASPPAAAWAASTSSSSSSVIVAGFARGASHAC